MGLNFAVRLFVACSSTAGLGLASACAFDAGSLGGGLAEDGSSSGGSTESSTAVGTDGSTGSNDSTGGTTDSGGTQEGGPETSATESTGQPPGEDSSSDTTGGVTPVFVDAGLLVRYFIDESAEGSDNKTVLDAAADPLDIAIEYVDALVYDEVEGQRGLRWDAAGQDGGPITAVAGSKLTALEGREEATIEVVVDVEGVSGSGSRFVHFGVDTASDFALAADAMNEVHLRVFNATVGEWPVDLSAGRMVLTAVVDTQQAQPSERYRLYVDGTRVEGTVDETIQTTALDLADEASFVLGNRSNGQRSFTGMLHYAAVYEEALSPAEIQSNASLLLASDDAP